MQNKSQKDPLSIIRHDIKNDLTVVKLNLSLIEKNPDKRSDYIHKIEERIGKILEKLDKIKSIP